MSSLTSSAPHSFVAKYVLRRQWISYRPWCVALGALYQVSRHVRSRRRLVSTAASPIAVCSPDESPPFAAQLAAPPSLPRYSVA